MLVLGVRNAEARALAISDGSQGDDLSLLNCLERVSYTRVFLMMIMCLIFVGVAFDKVSYCRAIDGGTAGGSHCRARGGQCLIARGA
jgi:hypothetical protein